MENDWKNELLSAVHKLRTKQDIDEFFSAILTPKEYSDVVTRLQIAKALLSGAAQRTIRDTLGVSIATVTRGAREIQYGNGAFQKSCRRLQS